MAASIFTVVEIKKIINWLTELVCIFPVKIARLMPSKIVFEPIMVFTVVEMTELICTFPVQFSVLCSVKASVEPVIAAAFSPWSFLSCVAETSLQHDELRPAGRHAVLAVR